MGEKSEGGKGERSSGKGRLKVVFPVLLVVFIIALLFAFFGMNTERGRSVVQDWLGRRLSMDLRIGDIRLGGPADLVLREVESVEKDETGLPLFSADELRVGVRFQGLCRISVHKADLKMVPDGEGGWNPHAFSKLGNLPSRHMGDLSKLTAGLRRLVRLSVTDSSISWMGDSGIPDVSLTGLSFEMKPVSLADRDVYFYSLDAYNVLGAGNTNIHNIHREWLASDAAEYIGVDKLAPQANVTAVGFWEIKQ